MIKGVFTLRLAVYGMKNGQILRHFLIILLKSGVLFIPPMQ
jgi:hypothetical protein